MSLKFAECYKLLLEGFDWGCRVANHVPMSVRQSPALSVVAF